MSELYTIGYEGTTQEAVIRTLLMNDMDSLLDIREVPLSRKPGFSKTKLGAAVAAHGMRYEHIRELGTPRDIRYRRKVDHDQVAFRTGFLEYLDTQSAAMETLVERAVRERCCLLCFEANVQECHRLLVAERAREMSAGAITLVHLDVLDVS